MCSLNPNPKNEVENSKKLLLLAIKYKTEQLAAKSVAYRTLVMTRKLKKLIIKKNVVEFIYDIEIKQKLAKLPYNNPSFHVPSKQQSKKHKENNTDA